MSDEERPRRSWREIDRMRDGARSRGSRGEGRDGSGRAPSADATRAYLSRVERELFARSRGGAEAERLGRAVVDALGTPGLDDACRAHLEALGPPREPAVLSAFLDARDREIRLVALRALAAAGSEIELTPGLRAQLRTLAEDLDDELAEAAEDALAAH